MAQSRRESTMPGTHELVDLGEQELIRAYLDGAHSAFEEIVTRHKEQMTWVAKKYSRCESDTEEILQEALLKVSTKLETYKGTAPLQAWLNKIVAHTGYDRRTKETVPEDFIVDDPSYNHYLNSKLSHDPFAEFLEQLFMSTEIRNALNEISHKYRTAIILVDLLGYTIEEAAELQKVEPITIRTRRSRGRSMMKKILSGPPYNGNTLWG